MGKAKPTSVNEALRKAGFLPIPRWWVKQDELDVIHRIAHNHAEHVNEIRAQCRGEKDEKDER